MANVIINDTNLTNIANAIREKNGLTDTYKPSEMAGAILAIQAGGGTGGGNFEWPNPINMVSTINKNGDYDWIWSQAPAVTIRNDGTSYGFSKSEIEDVSNLTIINIGTNGLHYYFMNSLNMKKMPKFHLLNPISNFSYFFAECKNLREIPEDVFMLKNDGTYASTGILAFNDTCRTQYLFSYCYSLRKHPIIHDGTQRSGYSSQSYQGMFTYCYALDEIINLPVYTGTATSNKFTYGFDSCSHLKKFTFATQEDGTPYSATWSNQTIDLSSNVGYAKSIADMLNYNSGLTEATQLKANTSMTDAERLAIMTNYPDDWWTTLPSWSRYTHASAVETINSLPDCSAGSSNVIHFKSASGTSHPEGKIGNLTEEEIAVATAKGWTVSLV